MKFLRFSFILPSSCSALRASSPLHSGLNLSSFGVLWNRGVGFDRFVLMQVGEPKHCKNQVVLSLFSPKLFKKVTFILLVQPVRYCRSTYDYYINEANGLSATFFTPLGALRLLADLTRHPNLDNTSGGTVQLIPAHNHSGLGFPIDFP